MTVVLRGRTRPGVSPPTSRPQGPPLPYCPYSPPSLAIHELRCHSDPTLAAGPLHLGFSLGPDIGPFLLFFLGLSIWRGDSLFNTSAPSSFDVLRFRQHPEFDSFFRSSPVRRGGDPLGPLSFDTFVALRTRRLVSSNARPILCSACLPALILSFPRAIRSWADNAANGPFPQSL